MKHFVTRAALVAACALAGPAVASTVAADLELVAAGATIDPSPFTTALEAQRAAGAAPADANAVPGAHILAVQIALLVAVVLCALRPLPPSSAVAAIFRQAASAAVARSRTRATIARNPFDL